MSAAALPALAKMVPGVPKVGDPRVVHAGTGASYGSLPPPSPAIAAGTPRAKPRLNAASCLECGGDFERVGPHGSFCAPRCRMAWNNRRRERGADLYDLFMAIRYDRPRAKLLGLWTLLCRAASLFHDEDLRLRAGRRSWSDPADVVARKPWLRGRILQRGRA